MYAWPEALRFGTRHTITKKLLVVSLLFHGLIPGHISITSASFRKFEFMPLHT